jgi:uncharacterized protein (TIGR00255 family)
VRSVNGRGLDLRIRLPAGYEALESKVREQVTNAIKRGSISVSLNVERTVGVAEVRLNEVALSQVVAAAERLRHLTGAEPARADGLLALKGVLEVVEEREDEETTAARHGRMLKSFEAALAGLVAARQAEGMRLRKVVEQLVAEIADHVRAVERSPVRSVAAIRARISDQVARLLDTSQGLDPVRLHQEAVLIATRADVEEELKRLMGHIEASRELIGSGGAIGRKLDFLAQEFNREANTLTSKSIDAEITRAGLALKSVIDQMREQVQNIE